MFISVDGEALLGSWVIRRHILCVQQRNAGLHNSTGGTVRDCNPTTKSAFETLDYHMLRDFIHEFLIPYRELASLQKTSNHLRKTSLHLRRPLERFGSSSEDRAIFRRHQDIFGRPRVVFGMRWQSFRYRWYLRMSSFDRRYCTIAKLIVCGIGSPAEQSCAMIGYPRGQDGAILLVRDCPLPARHYSQ